MIPERRALRALEEQLRHSRRGGQRLRRAPRQVRGHAAVSGQQPRQQVLPNLGVRARGPERPAFGVRNRVCIPSQVDPCRKSSTSDRTFLFRSFLDTATHVDLWIDSDTLQYYGAKSVHPEDGKRSGRLRGLQSSRARRHLRRRAQRGAPRRRRPAPPRSSRAQRRGLAVPAASTAPPGSRSAGRTGT